MKATLARLAASTSKAASSDAAILDVRADAGEGGAARRCTLSGQRTGCRRQVAIGILTMRNSVVISRGQKHQKCQNGL
jgi:hypothetical protein